MASRIFSFVATASGPWRVTSAATVVGEALPVTSHLTVVEGIPCPPIENSKWVLHGITSNERYVTQSEKSDLVQKQAGLGRAASVCAALIPVRKSPAWWALAQDERRRIFEEQSNHIKIGTQFLPAIARRLHHCRDLGADEPFDFLTWFEYAPSDAPAFDDLLGQLRQTLEWKFVTRELDFRLERIG